MKRAMGMLSVLAATAIVACSSAGAGGGAGAIRITSATYGKSCGAGADVSSSIAATCSGKDTCTCDKSCFSGDADPYPGCAKGLDVTYQYDGVTRTVSCPAVGDEAYTLTIDADGKAECAPAGSSSSSSSGGCSKNPSCTSDSDCHDKCKRCDRCSGSCVSRLSC